MAEKKANGGMRQHKQAEFKKKQIQKEMREAWSEQKERKARKEDRKDKKDKRQAAEWAAKGDQEAIGPVEAFRRSKKRAGQDDEDEDDEEDKAGGGFDVEYKNLKREVKQERAAKKGKKEITTVGMFDGLD